MITAYTGRAAPITVAVCCNVCSREFEPARRIRNDPQSPPRAGFRSTPLWKRTAVPYKPPFRKDRRFNKIRSIDRLATMTSLSDCIMAFRILVERVLERRVWFLIPAVSCRGPYRRRRSVFPLFIGQGLRRKYRRRPLGGIMKFRLPYWCETVRDRGMCARGLQDTNDFRLYVNWVGLVVLLFFFFFFPPQNALRLRINNTFDLCFN